MAPTCLLERSGLEQSNLPFLPVSELAGFIESKEVSPVEAAQAYLERIDSVDGKINSYITVCKEEALKAAREAEDAILKGNYKGPMHGIPVAVKDQIFTKGIRTTAGSTILWDLVPEEDATVITNLKEAGAVLLGKLNLSEFARGGNFYHPAGTPHNPWNLDYNPGFSSSGSGAATAAFLCAASLGEDTGGSTRIPAAFCGVVGFRPSWGRVSRFGVLPVSWSMDAVGPISRTAEDCAITLKAIAGYDPKDAYTWNMPVPDYRKALNGDIKDLKIGVIKEGLEADGLHPEVRDAILKAVDALKGTGVSVEEVSIPLVEQAGAFSRSIGDIEGAGQHYEWLKTRPQDYDRNIRVRLLTGLLTPAQAYFKAQKLRSMLRQQVLDVLDRVDVLVLPATPTPPPKLMEGPGIKSREEAARTIPGPIAFTGPFNLASTPALVIPCGFTADSLPISMQIAGRPFDEETVLRVAYAYEQNTPWHLKRPPI